MRVYQMAISNTNHFAKSSWMLTAGSIALVVAALYLAQGVLVPLTLAVLLSFLLSPVCDWLERRGLGRIPSVLATAVLGFAALGAVAWMAVVQITELAPKMPEYQHNLQAKLHSTNEYLSAALAKVTRTTQDIGHTLPPSELADELQGRSERTHAVRIVPSPASPMQVVSGTFGTILYGIGATGVVILLVVFFLVRREDLRDRFIRLIGQGHVTVTTQMLEDAGTRVSRYLATQFLINVTFGAAVGIGLFAIGVPNAILWGILAATLRFVPYIGPWIAAAMPVGLSMAMSASWLAPILTVALFVVLELISNNVMEPWLYGKSTGVSAVAVLMAAVFWTWLWGIAGLLLATPLTVCLLVIGKHVPQLSFLNILLGNEPVFEPKKRVYQRLLAGDQEEAAELVEEFLERQPLVEVYDTVLIPALALAETHWHRGELDEGRHKFIMETLTEIVQDQTEGRQEILAKEDAENAQAVDGDSDLVEINDSEKLSILCLPARDEADDIAAMMLAQVLASGNCIVQSASVTSLASEMVALVEQRKADVVCISATPPAAVMHARYLCKRLRERLPKVKLLVGLWDAQCDLNKARARIGSGAIIVATLADAQEQIRVLCPPRLKPSEQQPARDAMVLQGANR
jgi:predicted PurR-regulated permease PerM